MTKFVVGQRWLVDSEPELGLGMLQAVGTRSITLFFPAVNSERHYASRDAPLTRYRLDVGDLLQHRDKGALPIARCDEIDGLIIYTTDSGESLPETELAATVAMTNPLTRLKTGQLDQAGWFTFRSALESGIQAVWNSHLNGLLGTRSDLLPHQLYIATQATEQPFVRVLLADEVGLGKTIEAGLIINRLKQQERIKRVLIAVPEALQAQWLVELIRRFSLYCELYQHPEHDFALGQVHLVTHDHLFDETKLACLRAEEWDLLVVDEAHHLPTQVDGERTAWTDFAHQTDHLLLLTATPEQLGQQAHFGRLQLLDATRFSSFDRYRKEEARFAQLSDLAVALANQQLQPQHRDRLAQLGIRQLDSPPAMLNALLDRHGTGRILYRNTRKSIAGFHRREVTALLCASEAERIAALVRWLQNNNEEKILLICRDKQVAQDLAYRLLHQHGIQAAVFHEDLDLIERDRAAAHFADAEDGAQLLVCSEIGGEGRNFQFCHQLILWDLPAHPDILAQRIGRLDRIGQTHEIQIIPILTEGSSDAARLGWYHQVLNCIEPMQPAAGLIHDRYHKQWQAAPTPALQQEVSAALGELSEQLEQGRDLLLELNSCRQPRANDLKNQISALEQHHPLAVVEMAANLLNLHFESIAADIYQLIPSSNMLIPSLPGIPEAGALVTFSRVVANQREDVLFLSWEHPFIQGLEDMLQGSELGQATVALLATEKIPAGKLLLEVLWRISLPERYRPALQPHFAACQFRTLLLEGGQNDLADALPLATIGEQLSTVPLALARKISAEAKERIDALYDNSQQAMLARYNQAIQQATAAMKAFNQDRIDRLDYLATINPLVSKEDVALLAERIADEEVAMTACDYAASSVRLILCVPLQAA